MSIALTVVRLAKIVEIVLGAHELTLNQYRMLTFADVGAPPLAELSRRLVMKPPNVTVLIDGLVERNLIVRSRDREDGRRIRLRLTPTGRRRLRRADAAIETALRRLVEEAGSGDAPIDGMIAWESVLDRVAVATLHDRMREAGEIA